MARKNALNHVFYNLLALTLTILLAVAEAEGKGTSSHGSGSSHDSPGSSRGSPKSSSSGSEITKAKDSTGVTRCYNEKTIEVTCPATKGQIAGYIIAGFVGVFLLLFLYVMIKKKIAGRRKAFNAGDRDLEVGQENQQMFRHAKGPAGKDDDSSDISPPPPYGHVNGSNPSGSAIHFPTPEPSHSNILPEPLTPIHADIEPSSVPITTPARKNTLMDRFMEIWN